MQKILILLIVCLCTACMRSQAQDVEDMGEVCYVDPTLCEPPPPPVDVPTDPNPPTTDPSPNYANPTPLGPDPLPGDVTSVNATYNIDTYSDAQTDQAPDDSDYWTWFYTNGQPPTPPPPSPSCYIMLPNGQKKRYFTGTQAYVSPGVSSLTLTVADQNNVLTAPSSFNWVIAGNPTCSGTNACQLNVAPGNIYNVQVNDQNGNQQVLITLTVEAGTIVRFHQQYYQTQMNQPYGFDEDGYQYPAIANNYTTRNIHGQPYPVPWMSLLVNQPSQTVTVELLATSAITSNPNFSLTFTSSNSLLTVNGNSSYTVTGSAAASLQNIQLKMSGAMIAPATIDVTDNSGVLVGELILDSKPAISKKADLVYVNTGNGYRTKDIIASSLIQYYNSGSFNQIFRQFAQTNINNAGGWPYLLDISKDYAANPGSFSNTYSVTNMLIQEYINKYGLNINNANPGLHGDDPNRICFLFITDIPTGNFTGITNGHVGNFVASVFQLGSYSTCVHETGHMLNLYHTFVSPTNIPYGTTRCFMDYGQYPDMFFYYEWVNAF